MSKLVEMFSRENLFSQIIEKQKKTLHPEQMQF